MVCGDLPEAEIVLAAIRPVGRGETDPDDTQYQTSQPASPPLPAPLPDACDDANIRQRTIRPLVDSAELQIVSTPGRKQERSTLYDIPAHSAPQESTENCRQQGHNRRTTRFETERRARQLHSLRNPEDF